MSEVPDCNRNFIASTQVKKIRLITFLVLLILVVDDYKKLSKAPSEIKFQIYETPFSWFCRQEIGFHYGLEEALLTT